MDFTTSDGVRLSYLQEGAGPTVVLVSGFGAPAVTWHFQREALVAAGFEVLTLDRRHTGASEFPDHGLRMSRHGADVAEFLTSLGRPAALVGSSMGASTIYSLVDTFGTANITAACVVDQTPKMLNDEGWPHGFYGLTWHTLPDWVARFPGDLNPFHAMPPTEVLAVLASAPAPDRPLDAVRPLLLDHAEADWRDVLPRMDFPLLVVGGRHSPFWPVEHAEWCAAAAPRATLAILEGSGHAPHLSEPQVFNETLIRFLR